MCVPLQAVRTSERCSGTLVHRRHRSFPVGSRRSASSGLVRLSGFQGTPRIKMLFPPLLSSFDHRSPRIRARFDQPEHHIIVRVGNGMNGSGNISSPLLPPPPTLSSHLLRWFYLHELINPSLWHPFIHPLSPLLHSRGKAAHPWSGNTGKGNLLFLG